MIPRDLPVSIFPFCYYKYVLACPDFILFFNVGSGDWKGKHFPCWVIFFYPLCCHLLFLITSSQRKVLGLGVIQFYVIEGSFWWGIEGLSILCFSVNILQFFERFPWTGIVREDTGHSWEPGSGFINHMLGLAKPPGVESWEHERTEKVVLSG